MTDEQRGQTRPDGDVAHDDSSATTAGDSPTQHTTTTVGGGSDGADHPTDPYSRPDEARGGSPYAYGNSVYGTPGYAQHGGPGTDQGRPYGSPAYGPYSGAQPNPGPTYGAAGMPGAGGPVDPPQGPGNTAVIEGEKPRRPSRPMVGIVAAALIAGIVGGGAGFGGSYALLDRPTASSGSTLTGEPASNTSSAPVDGSVQAAAAKATPSTVDIRVQLAQGSAEGSGVILTSDGDVLTNNHVVAGSTGQIQVTLSDGTTHTATVVGTSPSYDLAVIKLDGVSGLTAATLGQTSGVQVGQQVVAIGSPQGLTGTVTTGIVSALNRTVAVQGDDGSGIVYNGLQTDAPINQGNSGGPLVNLDGQVVGINSAIATAGQSSGSVGLGFAIPVDQARRVAQEIMNTGQATKPVLGVQGSTGGSTSGSDGATVEQVTAGGPAAAAGLQQGDVVTKVGDASVSDFSDLIARIGSYAPGDKVTLTVGSGASARTVEVTLGSTPDTGATTSSGGTTQGTPQQQEPQQQDPFGGLNPFGRGGN
ncbi:trypsin-like peptidase domain-containing protein [Pseudonocardia pini]|uniref:trypsin-like peptidase domain-containing protein n=1 Tax=Pseudonocardia pini TaxID=2758030 RepID=UPI0015EFDDB2|nr:trypsin-like peptidase domain-containing protein [Pseudonocardia pini]